MSPLPQLILLTDLDLSVRPAGLVELAAGELGNAGAPSDGFDAAFDEIALFLGTGESVAVGLDAAFAELAGAGPLPDPATLDSDVLAFAADKVTSDGILADFSALLGPAAPPPPAVSPAPPPPPVAVTPAPPAPPPPPLPAGGGGSGGESDALNTFADLVFGLGSGGGGGARGERTL